MKLECPWCGSEDVNVCGADLFRCGGCFEYFDEGEQAVTHERSSLRRHRERKYDEESDD